MDSGIVTLEEFETHKESHSERMLTCTTMPNSMPWTLIVAFTLLLGFGAEQQRQLRNFRGRSQGFLESLNLSVFLATITALALLVYYGAHTSWYWPIVIFALATTTGPTVFGYIARQLGEQGSPIICALAFVGWPASEAWTFYLIKQVHP